MRLTTPIDLKVNVSKPVEISGFETLTLRSIGVVRRKLLVSKPRAVAPWEAIKESMELRKSIA